jgi:tetratricopeptide (TPR) repeat protein
LVEQNLLRQASGTDGEPRFTMLETIREFALEHLAASGEESTIRSRHAGYFLRWVEAGKPLFFLLEQGPWLEQLEGEHANVRLALAWLVEHGDGAESLSLACALGPFWRMRGYTAEGFSWVERVLTTEEPASLYVEALVLGSGLALDLHRHGRAAALAETAVAVASSHGTVRDLARAQLRLATVLAVQGDTMRTRQLIGDALRTSREAGDHRTVAWALLRMALEPMASGSHDEAITLLNDAMAAARAGECYVTQSSCLYNLGSIAYSRGEVEQAIRFVEEAIALSWRIGDTDGAFIMGNFLGYLRANELGDDAGAALLLEEALAYSRKVGDDRTEAENLYDLGRLATRQGNLALAQSRHEAALRLYQSVSDALTADLGFADAMIGLGEIARAQGDLPLAIERFRQGLERLRPIALERWDGTGNDVLWLRVAVAESLRLFVVTAGSVDNAQQAIRLLGAADAFRTASMNGVLHMERVRHDADAAYLSTSVDAATFDQLWALGQDLSVDDALTEALALPLAPSK